MPLEHATLQRALLPVGAVPVATATVHAQPSQLSPYVGVVVVCAVTVGAVTVGAGTTGTVTADATAAGASYTLQWALWQVGAPYGGKRYSAPASFGFPEIELELDRLFHRVKEDQHLPNIRRLRKKGIKRPIWPLPILLWSPFFPALVQFWVHIVEKFDLRLVRLLNHA